MPNQPNEAQKAIDCVSSEMESNCVAQAAPHAPTPPQMSRREYEVVNAAMIKAYRLAHAARRKAYNRLWMQAAY
jgi:hypothetical protein